jgi:hypothetical protein
VSRLADDCEADRRFKAELIQMYAEAVNRIDDYFEYMNRSEEDKLFVRKVLADLNYKAHEIKRKWENSENA